jgi:hypothetical protein
MLKLARRSKAQFYCLCVLIGLTACSEMSAQSNNPASDSQPPDHALGADAARNADADTTTGQAPPPSTDSASDAQQSDSGLSTDGARDADAGTATDAAPRADATTTTEVVRALQPGVVLSPDSSITLPFAGSHASYLPAQPGCGAEYEAIISVDEQMVRAVEITFGDAEQLDTDYPLQPCESCNPIGLTNFLVGDSGNIQVNINGIEAPAADKVSMGSIKFQGLTGNLELQFSFSFFDGKLLQGTFNLPIKQDLSCPGPSR